MRLLKTHSHTSERLGYEARKNAKKSRKTQALRMIRQTTVNILPRTTSVAGGARRRKAIEGKRRRCDKGNQRQNPPADRQRGGGQDKKAKTNTKWKGGTTHSPAQGGTA